MTTTKRSFTTSQAATQLGVSAKALRLYEERGLISPTRSNAGWRLYDEAQMERASLIVTLRDLGLSLADVRLVIDGGMDRLDAALGAHCERLSRQVQQLQSSLAIVGRLKQAISAGSAPDLSQLTNALRKKRQPILVFDLPWPWGGERFEMFDVGQLNFITGPLACGKTRLAMKIVEHLPDAQFITLDRLNASSDHAPNRTPSTRRALDWLAADGATINHALVALLGVLEDPQTSILVIDMIEQDLCATTQEALMRYLRLHKQDAPPLFAITRSSAVLDFDLMQENERIIFCPANHHPPIQVLPVAGTPGFEAVESCVASPAVRMRSAGVIAVFEDVQPQRSAT